MSLQKCIENLIHRKNLNVEQTSASVEYIASGKADPVQIAAFLTLLQAKGETTEEVFGFVETMLKHSIHVPLKYDDTVDIVGTGGDGANTVNISTASAILTAACGVKVAKHGSRSASSRSGSADVLEVLGIPMLAPHLIPSCIEKANIAFMYAPHFHPATKYVMPVRSVLGVRTIFNILGPLINPSKCECMVVGVYTPNLLQMFAEVFQRMNLKHALVIHCCGLDELSPLGPAIALEVKRGEEIRKIEIDPSKMNIPSCTLNDLKGGNADDNARIIRKVFSGGEHGDNAVGNTIALNTAAALYVSGTVPDIMSGYKMAKETLLRGDALRTLDSWSKIAKELHSPE